MEYIGVIEPIDINHHRHAVATGKFDRLEAHDIACAQQAVDASDPFTYSRTMSRLTQGVSCPAEFPTEAGTKKLAEQRDLFAQNPDGTFVHLANTWGELRERMSAETFSMFEPVMVPA